MTTCLPYIRFIAVSSQAVAGEVNGHLQDSQPSAAEKVCTAVSAALHKQKCLAGAHEPSSHLVLENTEPFLLQEAVQGSTILSSARQQSTSEPR